MLRPHQIEPARHLTQVVDRYGAGLDASKTGTGKTYVAASIIAASHLPTLVVGPKVSRSSWERAADAFGDTISFAGYEMLRTGNTPFGKWSNGSARRERYLKCQVCQRVVDLQHYFPCPHHPAGIHCLETKSRQHDYGTFSFAPEVKQIVFDEVHRCGALDSLNRDMLEAAKRQHKRILCLSATPAQSPLQMRALGYVLDVHGGDHDRLLPGGKVFPGFFRWAGHYGCRRDPRFRGFKWLVGQEEQQRIMLEIRSLLIPSRGVMVSHSEIPDFPECDIQAELYDLDDPKTLDQLYAEMADSLGALQARSEKDVAPDSPLTRILRSRQRIELLKVPIAAELAQDSLDKGFSVVLFVNFRQTIDELQTRFPEALVIDGTPDSVRSRDTNLEKFQSNECRTLIVNNEAGGVSLSMQDLTGDCPRIGYVMPNFSAVSMKQVFGRLPRDGGRSKCFYRVLFVARSVEVPIHRAVTSKLNNLDALTDGDLCPQNLALTVSSFRS